MKYCIIAMIGLCTGGIGWALDKPKLSETQIQEMDERDAELSGKIAGVWISESMGPNFVHVAQRTIYREDGTFVSDFRISSAGNIKYRRGTGVWYVVMGWFCEQETKSTDGQLIPRMIRWVNDPVGKELKTVSRTGMNAVSVRGDAPAKDFDYSLKGISEKELCASLLAKNMLGFLAEDTGKKDPDGNPLYSWVLKSRLIEQQDPPKGKSTKD